MFCKERTQILQLLSKNLVAAQSRIKQYADKNRSERSFDPGDMVYLCVKPYRQSTLAQTKFGKLAHKYFGPFQVEEKLGAVAYKLKLPLSAKIHPVFHVSLLKKKIGQPCSVSATLPSVDVNGQFLVVPIAILDRKMVKRNNAADVEVLVQWSNTHYLPRLHGKIE